MTKLSQLRLSLFSLIKRQYYVEKWIGDESLLSILQSQFGQKDLTKSYLNKYMSHIGLDTINIFNHKEEYLLYQNQNVRRAYFYIFSSKCLPPNKLSRKEYAKLYFEFRILRSDHISSNSSNNTKRKSLCDITYNTDISSSTNNIISPEQKEDEKIQVKINIGNYFTSRTTKKNNWLQK